MKVQRTAGVMIGLSMMGAMACNQIEEGKKDVGTAAASMVASAEDMIPLLSEDVQADTVINPATSTTAQDADDTYTETEVVRIDTVSTRIVYDVRRRVIEEVDTIGATKTYEIKRTVLKRTVQLDTLTETKDEEQTVAYEQGDFKKLDEQVESDSIVKVIDYQSEKQATATAAKSSEAKTDKPSQTDVMPPAEASSTGGPGQDAAPQDTTQRSDSGS